MPKDPGDVSLYVCFGVRFSVMFRFMFVHYTFSSVWVAEWPPFGKKLPARLTICSHCILSICNKNIIMSTFKSSRDTQKKEGGPDSCFG